MLAGLKSSLLLTLIGRLYYLQIVKSDEYKTFSDSNRIRDFLIPPLRGKILDRNGELFAGNKNYYRALFDPETSSNDEQIVNELTTVLGLDEAGKAKMMKKMQSHKSRQSLALYEHLNWNEVAKVEVNTPDLPGVSIDVGQIRFFPTGTISSHVTGYMGPVSDKEIEANPLLNHPDFKIGRSGIEQALEQNLRGEAGVRRMEVDAFGLSIRELSREESKPGKDVRLTLDKNLQEFIGKRMEGLSASTVAVDISNGNILAMVSTPGFDPNEFTYGVKPEYWKELTDNLDKPLINKAIVNQYPPGSTFKTMVALAALKDGVDPKMKVNCPGYVYLGRRRFNCWKEHGHGNMDMTLAIQNSCNAYFYTVSKRLGVDKIMEVARKFGLGKEIGVILSGEKPGLVPSSEWKLKKYKDKWQVGDTLNVGIGQGYILATPIQLAMMSARIASGKMIKPRMVLDEGVEEIKTFENIDVPKEHLDLVRDGMNRVVNIPGGTAYGSRIQNPKYSMAGKTGTSQVISKEGLESSIDNMSQEEVDRTKNHALFIGFGPVENPRYAVAVIVEHGGGGSKAAAPVGRDIMEKLQADSIGDSKDSTVS